MIETILLSTCCLIIGALVGSTLMRRYCLHHQIKIQKLPNGKEIHMWRGFVAPEYTYVAVSDENGDELTGDSVMFDEDGHIIQTQINAEER